MLTLYSQQPRDLYERRARVVGRVAAAGRYYVLALRRRLLLVLRIFRPTSQPAVVVGRFVFVSFSDVSIPRACGFNGNECQHASGGIAVG